MASTAVQVAEGDLGILAGSLGAHPKDFWCHADAKVLSKCSELHGYDDINIIMTCEGHWARSCWSLDVVGVMDTQQT